MKWSTILLSKSSPPRWVSPAVDLTSKMPSSMVRIETSKVPPPRSKIRTLHSAAPFFLSRPCNGGSGRLVDDPENVEAGDDPSVLGGQALGVVEVGGDGDHRVLDVVAEVGLRRLLHLGENHGGNLFRGEHLLLVLVLDLQLGLATVLDDRERPVLHVGLDGRLVELAADQSLGVEHSVVRVNRNLVLRSVTNQTFGVGEGNIAGCCSVALVVGDDLHLSMLEDSDAGVGGAKVNADSGFFRSHFFLVFCLKLNTRVG